MFTSLFHKEKKITKRNFDNALLVDANAHRLLAEQGYVVFKNVLTKEEISYLKYLYIQYTTHDGFLRTDYYINSIGFDDNTIREELKQKTSQYLEPILARIYKSENTFFPLGGGFAINPAQATRGCLIHQDPTFVDEDKEFSMTTWISLDDTNTENGCIYAIPKSHLWGNKYRSVTLPWLFNACADALWQYMQPVPVNAGDILCFDVALIHGSKENRTDKDRLAITMQALPKNTALRSYAPKSQFFIEEYEINGDYFINESQYQKPSKQYKRTKLLLAQPQYTTADIFRIIDQQNKD
ncbi:MAG: phytanoyl-CoA dioxygenase family protein [Bacteroidetes bacterium]|nr:phytanoyl-CoA dioxygenase family protein [Bacteroidota bacterium]